MAYTTPRTWVAGEKPTAATMNTHIRDNLVALAGDRTAYTPTIVGTAAPTLLCKYGKINKLVFVEVNITLTAVVTAGLTMSLPSTSAMAVGTQLGQVEMQDVSAALERLGTVRLQTTTTASFSFENATPVRNNTSATTPFTWASGDKILGAFWYWEA